jgi:transposase
MRLAGDAARGATSYEVKGLRAETRQFREFLAELMIENRLLKKTCHLCRDVVKWAAL